MKKVNHNGIEITFDDMMFKMLDDCYECRGYDKDGNVYSGLVEKSGDEYGNVTDIELVVELKANKNKGLYRRFDIRKVTKVGDTEVLTPVDPDAEYFVLRLDTGGSDIEHIKACRIGIHAYAEAIQPHIPQLARDLIERYPLL